MIGDSITDLKAGHAANMPVVLVDYGYTDDISIYDHADMVIQDFSQMKSLVNVK
jgi:phosphoglycolate phosphatase-like HAD superfamily hydrolase